MAHAQTAHEHQHARTEKSTGLHLALCILHGQPQPNRAYGAHRGREQCLATGMGGVGSHRGTLNEGDGLSLSQFTNGQPNGEQCHGQTADHAVDNRLRLGMIDNIAVANRPGPIGIQQIHKHACVPQAGPCAQTGPEQGKHKALG